MAARCSRPSRADTASLAVECWRAWFEMSVAYTGACRSPRVHAWTQSLHVLVLAAQCIAEQELMHRFGSSATSFSFLAASAPLLLYNEVSSTGPSVAQLGRRPTAFALLSDLCRAWTYSLGRRCRYLGCAARRLCREHWGFVQPVLLAQLFGSQAASGIGTERCGPRRCSAKPWNFRNLRACGPWRSWRCHSPSART